MYYGRKSVDRSILLAEIETTANTQKGSHPMEQQTKPLSIRMAIKEAAISKIGRISREELLTITTELMSPQVFTKHSFAVTLANLVASGNINKVGDKEYLRKGGNIAQESLFSCVANGRLSRTPLDNRIYHSLRGPVPTLAHRKRG
jgi:hypothetical protein